MGDIHRPCVAALGGNAADIEPKIDAHGGRAARGAAGRRGQIDARRHSGRAANAAAAADRLGDDRRRVVAACRDRRIVGHGDGSAGASAPVLGAHIHVGIELDRRQLGLVGAGDALRPVEKTFDAPRPARADAAAAADRLHDEARRAFSRGVDRAGRSGYRARIAGIAPRAALGADVHRQAVAAVYAVGIGAGIADTGIAATATDRLDHDARREVAGGRDGGRRQSNARLERK